MGSTHAEAGIMTDLEGRALDEALERARGRVACSEWREVNFGSAGGRALRSNCTHKQGTCYPAEELAFDKMGGRVGGATRYHASLDALLRDIEPVCRERGMLRLSIEQAGENLWNAFAKMRSGMSQYEHGTGPTAATALARAFLAVLTRGES